VNRLRTHAITSVHTQMHTHVGPHTHSHTHSRTHTYTHIHTQQQQQHEKQQQGPGTAHVFSDERAGMNLIWLGEMLHIWRPVLYVWMLYRCVLCCCWRSRFLFLTLFISKGQWIMLCFVFPVR